MLSPYGKMDDKLNISFLKEICVPDDGIQTGPFGSLLHQKDYVPFGTPIITVEHLGENRIIHKDIPCVKVEDKERLARFLLREGDIVLSRVGSVDRRVLVRKQEEGWLFSGRCLRIRPNPEFINSSWLSWFFGLPQFKAYIRRIAFGSTMPSLNTAILNKVPIYYPNRPEQDAAAEILNALDDKIELNRQMNRTLEGMAHAIFKSWFVDFDPVTAKAAGRNPFGMKNATSKLFPDKFVGSEAGDIPQGSVVRPFSFITTIHGGGTPKTNVGEYWDGEIPWFSVVDSPSESDVFVMNTEKKITQKGLDESSSKLLEEGTTIITARGTVGNLALVGQPMAMNQSCYGLKGHNGFGSYFTYYSIKGHVRDLKLRSSGSVFDTIIRSTFDSIKIVVPPLGQAQEYEKWVAPLMEQIKLNLVESSTLNKIRELLLPRLLSGEIRVNQSKRIVEKVS